jgi:histidyl-tRNA synthetase
MSIEVIGSASVLQDAHFITMLDRYFHEKLQTNNYALLINYLGCAADRAAYNQKLKTFLEAASALCSQCYVRKEKNILRVFDCKTEACQVLYEDAPTITDNLCEPCNKEWGSLQDELELLSVSFVHNPKLVRGLDYYNKTVFEFVSNALGAQSAFCGGGRYDTLISLLGGKQDQPSIGAAFGIERIMLMLEPIKDTLPLPVLPALNVIMPLSPAQQPIALLLADQLLAAQLVTEVLLEGDSIKSMMRHANKLAAKYCLLLGDDEQATNTVTIKNMVNGTQERIAQVEAVRYLKG